MLKAQSYKSLLTVCLLVPFFTNCGIEIQTNGTSQETRHVSDNQTTNGELNLTLPEFDGAVFASITILVGEEKFQKQFNLEQVENLQMNKLPTGPARVILRILDADKKPLKVGSAKTEIQPGKMATLKMVLKDFEKPTTGGVKIEVIEGEKAENPNEKITNKEGVLKQWSFRQKLVLTEDEDPNTPTVGHLKFNLQTNLASQKTTLEAAFKPSASPFGDSIKEIYVAEGSCGDSFKTLKTEDSENVTLTEIRVQSQAKTFVSSLDPESNYSIVIIGGDEFKVCRDLQVVEFAKD